MLNLKIITMYNTLLLGCTCPKATALETIPTQDCPLNLGQLVRDWFVRKGNVVIDTATPVNNLPGTIAGEVIEDQALWDTLFAAVDSSKVVKLPIIGGDPTITAGTVISQGGGDNTTFNGQVENNAINPADVSRTYKDLASDVIKAIRKLVCEGDKLEVFWIDNSGGIWAWKDGDIITGIPVNAYIFGSKSNLGFGQKDTNISTYQVPYNYDEYLVRITPNGWNPLNV